MVAMEVESKCSEQALKTSQVPMAMNHHIAEIVVGQNNHGIRFQVPSRDLTYKMTFLAMPPC